MAQNRIQVKRTSTSGRTPNTTSSANGQYIAAGELALNMTDKTFFTSDGTNLIYVGANVNSLAVGTTITVNGSVGTAGQVLTSGAGTNAYWSTVSAGSGTVTSVATGNGMTGGPITSTGTVSVLANTGIVANTTGVFVNSAYIATISANNASYLGGTIASGYQTTAGLSANVATLTANNSTNLGDVAAANYVQNTDSRTLSGNLIFSGANVFYNTALFVGSNNSMNLTHHVITTNSTTNTSITANQITLNGANVVTTATAMKVYYANGSQAYP